MSIMPRPTSPKSRRSQAAVAYAGECTVSKGEVSGLRPVPRQGALLPGPSPKGEALWDLSIDGLRRGDIGREAAPNVPVPNPPN